MYIGAIDGILMKEFMINKYIYTERKRERDSIECENIKKSKVCQLSAKFSETYSRSGKFNSINNTIWSINSRFL